MRKARPENPDGLFSLKAFNDDRERQIRHHHGDYYRRRREGCLRRRRSCGWARSRNVTEPDSCGWARNRSARAENKNATEPSTSVWAADCTSAAVNCCGCCCTPAYHAVSAAVAG